MSQRRSKYPVITLATGFRCAKCDGPIDRQAYVRGTYLMEACCSRRCAESRDRTVLTRGLFQNLMVLFPAPKPVEDHAQDLDFLVKKYLGEMMGYPQDVYQPSTLAR